MNPASMRLPKPHGAMRSAASVCRRAQLSVVPKRSALAKAQDTESLESIVETLRLENERLRSQLSLALARSGTRREPQRQNGGTELTIPNSDDIAWPTSGENFWERPPRTDIADLPGGTDRAAIEQDSRPLHIAHITAEMAPIAKVGGLGDVVTGLARSCMARGHHVSVMMPYYESLPQDKIEDLKHEMDLDVPKGKNGTLRTSVWSGKIAGVLTYLIKPANWNDCNVFKGDRIYGGSYNELEAYLFLSRASLEFLKRSGQQPHIIQVHDWHASAVPLLYWTSYHEQGLWRPRIVLTIHNMENTGECREDEFFCTGQDGAEFAEIDRALDDRTIGHNPRRLNLMKGAISYSNAVTTVSPSYGNEILHGSASGWMKSIFGREDVARKFRGILNGIDDVEWDPATDPLIPVNYSAATIEGKALCKEYLQRGFGLSVDPSKPLVAVVSRLVPQKGIGLIHSAVGRSVEMGGQFMLLGSGHSDDVFKHMANGPYKDHPDCRLQIMYSEALAHIIYAAADIVLVPSLFEPCGLTQLIALRYGAVPVVRRTGGLGDTVRDVDNGSQNHLPANGFVFDAPDESSLYGALDRAIKLFKDEPAKWQELSISNMQDEVSWNKSAKEYVNLYNSIASKD